MPGKVKQIVYRFGDSHNCHMQPTRNNEVLCLGVRPGDDRAAGLEPDGLPAVGSIIKEGDPLYW